MTEVMQMLKPSKIEATERVHQAPGKRQKIPEIVQRHVPMIQKGAGKSVDRPEDEQSWSAAEQSWKHRRPSAQKGRTAERSTSREQSADNEKAHKKQS